MKPISFTDRVWGWSSIQRAQIGVPKAEDTIEAKAKELSGFIPYACIMYPELIPIAIEAGIEAQMVDPPFVWRWLLTQQGQDIADLADLWRLMGGMEKADRVQILAKVTETDFKAGYYCDTKRLFPRAARELVTLFAQRRLHLAHDAMAAAIQLQEEETLASAAAAVKEAQERLEGLKTPEPGWKDAVVEVVKDTEGARPLMVETGLAEHDAHIGGGFGAGWLVVIMAPPKAGKTALAVSTIAAHSLSQGGRVALVSLEMPRSQVIQRLLARESGVPVRAMNARDLTPTQRSILSGAADRVASWDLTVLSSSTMVDIAARLRVLHKAKPLTMAVIDYAQLVDNGLRDRREDIEATTRGTKLLAMELGIPILLLAQPNNSDAKDGTVGFFSGKGTGAIAADCDLMLIPSRAKDNPSSAGLEIAGGRHAEPRKWELGSLAFDGARMLFSERLGLRMVGT